MDHIYIYIFIQPNERLPDQMHTLVNEIKVMIKVELAET